MKLFVSYSHVDTRFVRKLCNDLDRHGYQVWRDERDLRVGDSIAEKIREAIDDADFFLLVTTPESIASPWVKREIDVGLNAELQGNIQKFLPILYRGAEVPSLVKGKLYADFRPGKYQKGLADLLKALNFDLPSISILAGCLIEPRYIGLVCELLSDKGYIYVKQWRPTVARLEITSGYLSYLRGERSSRSGEAYVFSPMSPIQIVNGTPVLSHRDVQVCFAGLREDWDWGDSLEGLDDDDIELMAISRFFLYFLGRSSTVYETVSYLGDYAVRNDVPTLRHDLPDLLKWWSSPSIPHGPQITVSISGKIGSWPPRSPMSLPL